MKKEKIKCPDCGGAQVNHHVAYTSSVLGAFVDPWTHWMDGIFSEQSFEWVGPYLTKGLAKIKLGYITTEPTDKDSYRAKVLWEEAKKRGIDMYEFHLFNIGSDMFVSHYEGEMRFFDVLPRPKNYNPDGLSWMDNKNKMKQHFIAAGIPVANGGVFSSKRKALKKFEELSKPLITKPNQGSRSRHTTVHLDTPEEFLAGFKKAQQLSPWVMVEEELRGFVHRGTLIDKKLVGILRREPAYVIADGIHTIAELIEIENQKEIRKGPLFHEVHVDDDAKQELVRNGYTLESIPAKDTVVALGQKTSRAVGGGITNVTEKAHPDNIALLELIAETVNDPLIGVDFIMEDISISWKDQPRCGVIECNSAPFIDLHHYPLVGEPTNVAALLWDIIYPTSKKTPQ